MTGWAYMKLLRRLAQGGVVLLNEVPSNLILGQVNARRASSIRVGRAGGGWVLFCGCVLVLVLLREATVGCHGGG